MAFANGSRADVTLRKGGVVKWRMARIDYEILLQLPRQVALGSFRAAFYFGLCSCITSARLRSRMRAFTYADAAGAEPDAVKRAELLDLCMTCWRQAQ